MNSNDEGPLGRYAWIPVVACQGLVALIPMVAVWRTLAIWPALRNDPDFDLTSMIVRLFLILLLPASALGLALSRSWGWSFAMTVDAAALSFLALAIIMDRQSPLWATWETAFLIVAVAVMLLPAVRSHYSRRKTPWILSWWARPFDAHSDSTLLHMVAGAQLILATLFLFWSLAFFPYSGGFSLWLLFSIFVSVELYSGRMLGRLLTLGWCIFGLVFWIAARTSAIAAASRLPAYPPSSAPGRSLLFCVYCWILGSYLLLTMLKGRFQAFHGASPNPQQGDS